MRGRKTNLRSKSTTQLSSIKEEKHEQVLHFRPKSLLIRKSHEFWWEKDGKFRRFVRFWWDFPLVSSKCDTEKIIEWNLRFIGFFGFSKQNEKNMEIHSLNTRLSNSSVSFSDFATQRDIFPLISVISCGSEKEFLVFHESFT